MAKKKAITTDEKPAAADPGEGPNWVEGEPGEAEAEPLREPTGHQPFPGDELEPESEAPPEREAEEIGSADVAPVEDVIPFGSAPTEPEQQPRSEPLDPNEQPPAPDAAIVPEAVTGPRNINDVVKELDLPKPYVRDGLTPPPSRSPEIAMSSTERQAERVDPPNWYEVTNRNVVKLALDGQIATFKPGHKLEDRSYDIDTLRKQGLELEPCEAPPVYAP